MIPSPFLLRNKSSKDDKIMIITFIKRSSSLMCADFEKILCCYEKSIEQATNQTSEQNKCPVRFFFFFTPSYIICIESVVTATSPTGSSYTGLYAEFRKTEGGDLWSICMAN